MPITTANQGARMRRVRVKFLRCSQETLAKRLKKSRRQVIRWELGECDMPTSILHQIRNIAATINGALWHDSYLFDD